MQAHPVFVTQYFDGTKQNVIPLFQRMYSWQKKHWMWLWEDIIGLLESSEKKPTHFMGAIVTLPARSVPVGVNRHLVIDGQQRLTTLSVLLCAIRDTVKDENLQGQIQDLIENHRFEGTDKVKLLPTQGDRGVYTDLAIHKKLPADSHPIKSAYNFFREKLSGKDNVGQQVNPESVFEVLQSALQVVMINLSDDDDPYLIFESLNYKGEPLSQADLVRNFVLMRFRHGLGDGGDHDRIYRDYWRPMEVQLGEHIEEFLRHYSMKEGAKVGRSGVYAGIKRRFQSVEGDSAVEAELGSMLRHSRYYERFVGLIIEEDRDLEASLSAIREMGRGAGYPFLLRVFDAHAQGDLADHELKKVVKLVESFMLRRTVCDVATNTLQRTFMALSRDFTAVDTTDWLGGALLEGDGPRRWPTDEEFARHVVESPQYAKSRTVGIILRRIEWDLDGKEPVTLDSTTIEHVMPKTLTPAWRSMLGDNYQETHKKWLDTMGNLTITGYNSELGNAPFDEKKERLSSSPIRLNAWIAEQETWNADLIKRRGQILASKAIRLWPRPSMD